MSIKRRKLNTVMTIREKRSIETGSSPSLAIIWGTGRGERSGGNHRPQLFEVCRCVVLFGAQADNTTRAIKLFTFIIRI